MDKKGNRTDLLAAGRKKLQQYRQKKDTKVKDGKGSSSSFSSSSSSSSKDHQQQQQQQQPVLDAADAETTLSSSFSVAVMPESEAEPLQVSLVGLVQDAPDSTHNQTQTPLQPHAPDVSSPQTDLSPHSILHQQHLPVSDTNVSTAIDLKFPDTISKLIALDSIDDQSVSAVVEGNTLDLARLAHLLNSLPDSDFMYLIQSRKMASHATDLPQTFQEQLYLAAVSKQLLQHHDLHMASDHVSPDEPSSELAKCRSDLEAAINERAELQDLYYHAKEEAIGYSATVDELKIKLDEASANLSISSAHSDQCKAQLEASLAKNEELLKNLASSSDQMVKYEALLEQYTLDGQKFSADMANSNAEIAALQLEIENLKSALTFAADERKKLEEENFILAQDKEMLSGVLADCRLQLTISKQEHSDLNRIHTILSEEHKKQKDNEEFLIQEIERLSAELVVFRDNWLTQHQEIMILIQDKEVVFGNLVDCRHQLTWLQHKNSDLTRSLALMNEEQKKQLIYEESIIQEIERLSAEHVVFQDKLWIQHQEKMQVEADLGEAMLRIEQLAEENIILQSSVEIYKAKLSDGRQMHVSSAGVGSMTQMNIADNLSGGIIGSQLCPADAGVAVLKGCLEEAEIMMKALEEATNAMHSHSVSLSRSIGRNDAHGVSKLIQAFESKAIDDPDPEVNPSIDNPVPSYLVAMEQINHLRCVLETLAQHVEHVHVLNMEENVRCRAADASCEKLEVEIESLKGISNNLEMRNIELEILYGAMSQHARDSEASKTELVNLFDTLKREYAAVESQNVELYSKLTTSNCRIGELQALLKEIQRSSDGVASTVYNEIAALEGEMKQIIYATERRWKSVLSQLHPAVVNLDILIGSSVSYPPPTESSDSGMLDHVLLSLSAACEVIEKLMLKVETHEVLSNSYMQVKDELRDATEKHGLAVAMLQKVSSDLVKLLDISSEHNDTGPHTTNQYDPLDAGYYEAIVSKVANLVGDVQALKESNKKLYADLLNRTNEIEELNKHYLDSDAVLKLVLDVKEALKLQDTEMDLENTPVLLLQTSVLLLVQKFRETEEKANLLTEKCNFRLIEIGKLEDNIEQLNVLYLQHQNEMLILKESLTQAKIAIDALQAELLEKIKELELSDQRVASVREKLSIAVAKGKGLVVQRDSLKHSLAEMSGELEKSSQETLFKDSRILELEEKLKSYSEAGERMEALESELTYIRNSATALRESFLMKDSALQKIEEIMEDLELPDHFHSKDTVEKVDWLAKSVGGNSFLHADWDQRSSVGGGSYSDAGLATDGGKEDVHPTLNAVDDLRRQYDELQTKFYELAEQNDMLEQSLMERNVLVQRWEEILDRINTPPQIRSMEPEERIHWLGTALSEADHHMRSLQQKIEKLENYCHSLSSDLEESQGRTSELQSSLQAIAHEKDNALSIASERIKSYQQKINGLENYSGSLSAQLEESDRRISEYESSLHMVLHDKEILSSNLVALTCNHELALHAVAQDEHDLDILRKDAADMLQETLMEKLRNENYIKEIENELRRLQGLILESLKDSETEDGSSDLDNIQCLERLIRKLMTRVAGIDFESPAPNKLAQGRITEHEVRAITVAELENAQVPNETVGYIGESKPRSNDIEGQSVTDLRIELTEALAEVARLREEIDEYSKKNHSMTVEFEELDKKKDELLELLNQEEQKSASLREKLNLAVRKGKSLIQQRDSLKQNIELSTNEIDRLKSEISHRDNSLLVSSHKINDLSLQMETYKAFDAENLILKNRLLVAEEHLQQTEHTMSLLLNKLGEIDTGKETVAHDPLLKLDGIGKMCSELHATTTSLEKDVRKSKKAAELLLAELNEVQERNDGLQEELARAYSEISTLSRDKDLADAAKVEALSHMAKLSDERKLQLTEMEKLQHSICEVKKAFFDLSSVADNAFTKDVEILNEARAHVESCLVHIGVDLVSTKEHGGLVSANKRFKDFGSKNSPWNNEVFNMPDDSVEFDVSEAAEQHLKQLTEAVTEFKEQVHSHSMSLRSEVDQFYSTVTTMLKAVDSERNSLELIKDEKVHLEAIVNERDMERALLCRSLSFLYEACYSSITEIENRKAQPSGPNLAAGDLRVSLSSLPSFDGENFNESFLSSSEQCVKALADMLTAAVKEFANMEIEDGDSHSKEMRSAIFHLQKELQEKDIQRERICSELVGQIKEAESAATKFSQDLQLAKNFVHELEQKLVVMGKEQTLLEQRVVELQHGRDNSIELGEKLKAMTTMVAAKEQEIEALMQALDEEENQMEALRNRVEELESEVQQKNLDLKHVEAYRAKTAKKLSVTVNKFDELHRMSEGLLSEIEVLQSQLQDRDSEISFLRQEVTRCTNDVLEATKTSKHQSYADLHEFLTWLDITLSHVLLRDAYGDYGTSKNYAECKEQLQKDIMSIISELEDSRIAAQNKDALLQAERNKVAELSQTKAALELSLNETEIHLNSLQGAGISGALTSEIVEVEPVVNKWTAPVVTSTSQVRNWRKANSDQVAIAIDTGAGSSGRLEDEDDDKVHGFKSLTTSKFVPKFTRPVSDMIDGLWVSCDRALMRQPAFRLGIIFYWALLHAMLASIMI